MEPLPTRQARIADVAARAGVAEATVSRVINGRSNVAEGTRARVLDAVEELDFRPSSLARNLSLQRTHAIGVVVPFFTSPSAIERLRGVVRALDGSPYDLTLFDVESADRRDRAFELLGRGDRVDAVLVVSLMPPDREIARLSAARIPCVVVDALHPTLPSVVIDDVFGGELATHHLIELGHRRIGFIGDKPPDEFRIRSSRDRTTGYEQALRRAGIDVRPEYIRQGTDDREIARRTATELLQLPTPPTAIFAASDIQALGALEAARDAGLRVPDDVSVVGFDDIELASYTGLTSIRQPLEQSGRRGAELLLGALAGEELDASTQVLPLKLVVRSTTAPPPGRH